MSAAVLRRDLDEQGFAVRPLLDVSAQEQLLALWRDTGLDGTEGFLATLGVLSHANNRRISEAAESLLVPALADVLPDHVVIGATFLVKGAGVGGVHQLHQDWTSVDEREARSVNVWCALEEVDAESGPLEVLPGSHRWFANHRGPALPSFQVPFGPTVDPHLVSLPVRAGDAVIYDHALVHGSRQNRSGRPRVVLQAGLAPRGVGLVMPFPSSVPEHVDLRAVDRRAFFEGFEIERGSIVVPPGRVIGSVPTTVTAAEDIVSRLGRPGGVASRRWVNRWRRRGRRGGLRP